MSKPASKNAVVVSKQDLRELLDYTDHYEEERNYEELGRPTKHIWLTILRLTAQLEKGESNGIKKK